MLSRVALRKNFEFKTLKLGKNILVVTCIDDNYKWRLCATKLRSSNIFEIKRYYSIDTCALYVCKRDNCHASYKVTRQKIYHKFDSASSSYRLDEIREEFQK